MAKRLELATDVVSPGTGLHADAARWEVGQALRELGAGELDPQSDGATLILADEMERAPCVARSPTAHEQAGQEHRRTIPLPAIMSTSLNF